MYYLNSLRLFAQVVQVKSFSEAARHMGIAKSAVSRQISILEKDVGTRLFNRSSRSLSLTEAGEIFYRYCLDMLKI